MLKMQFDSLRKPQDCGLVVELVDDDAVDAEADFAEIFDKAQNFVFISQPAVTAQLSTLDVFRVNTKNYLAFTFQL